MAIDRHETPRPGLARAAGRALRRRVADERGWLTGWGAALAAWLAGARAEAENAAQSGPANGGDEASQAACQAPKGWWDPRDEPGVVAAEELPDGQLRLIYGDGRIADIRVGEFMWTCGQPSVGSEFNLAALWFSLGGGSQSALTPVWIGGGVLVGATAAVGGGSGASAPPPEPAPSGAPPAFHDAEVHVSVFENIPVETVVHSVTADDPDGDAIRFSLIGGADAEDFTLDPDSGALRFRVSPDYEQPHDADGDNLYELVVRASDGTAGVDQRVYVTVLDVDEPGSPPPAQNQPPEAAPDAYATDFETALEIEASAGVLSNDADPDGDDLSAILISGPANGVLTLNADGGFLYTPDAGFSGVDEFAYRASDGELESESVLVTVTVAPPPPPPNAPPLAEPDAYVTAFEDPLSIPADGVLANDGDPDGDALAAILVSGPLHGALTLAPDGGFFYVPDTGFTGDDSFVYRAQDGSADSADAVVTITVEPPPPAPPPPPGPPPPPNTPPEASADAYATAFEAPLTVLAPGGVLANDTDADGDALSAVLISAPAHGQVTLAPDGRFFYVPNAGFSGDDSFTYRADDGQAQSATTTVTISVAPKPNTPPEAFDDAFSVNQLGVINGDVRADNGAGADADPDGDALTVIALSTGAVGDRQLVTDPAGFVLGEATVSADGTLVFDADAGTRAMPAGASRSAEFVYTISDGEGGEASASVTITVNGLNDAPEALDDAAVTDEDTPVTIDQADLLANDTDIDGDALSVTAVTDGANGSAVLNADGSVTYTPDADFHGADALTYTISDVQGGTAQAVIAITVNPLNDPPAADDDAYSTPEDTTLTVDAASGVLVGDSDPDGDPLTARLVSGPAQGVLTLNPNGSFEYEPEANFTGDVTFTYEAFDGQAASAPATVTITVGPVNDPPVAQPDAYSVNEDATLTVLADGVLGNDSDLDGDPLSAVLVSGPSNGSLSLNADGSFAYTPDPDFHGADSFTYQADDSQDRSAVTTVSITVNPLNDPPLASPGALAAEEDGPETSIDVTPLVDDVDGPGLEIIALSRLGGEPAGGSARFAGTDVFFDPGADFQTLAAGETLEIDFSYTVSDAHPGDPLTSTSVITVTVTGVNDAPVAQAASLSIGEDSTTAGTVQLQASDIDTPLSDLDFRTLAQTGGPVLGAPALSASGLFSFATAGEFEALSVGERETLTFSYIVDDGFGGTDQQTITVEVIGANDPPVLVGPRDRVVDERSDPGALFTATATDPDRSDIVTLSLTDASGLFTLEPDGDLVFTAGAAPEVSVDTDFAVRITADDGNGGVVFEDAVITVRDVIVEPQAADGAATLDEADLESGAVTEPVALAAGFTLGSLGALSFSPADGSPVENSSGDALTTTSGEALYWSLGAGRAEAFADLDGSGAIEAGERTDPALAVVFDGADAFTATFGGALDHGASDALDVVVAYEISGGSGAQTGVITLTIGDDLPELGTAPALSLGSDVFDEASGTLLLDYGADGPEETTPLSVTYRPDATDNLDLAFGEDLIVTAAGAPGVYTVSISDGVTTQDLFELIFDDASDTVTARALDLAPAIDEFAEVTIGLRLEAFDGDDDASAQRLLTVTQARPNQAPTAVSDAYGAALDSPTIIAASTGALVNDTDPENETLTVVRMNGDALAVGQPVSVQSVGGRTGLLTLNADGSITFDPNGGFDDLGATGADLVRVSYEIEDSEGETAPPAHIEITVSAQNLPPLAPLVVLEVSEDGPAESIDLLAAASDPDGSDDELEIVSVTLAAGESTQASWSLDASGFFLADPLGRFETLAEGDVDITMFDYVVRDGRGDEAAGRLELRILGENDPPELVADTPVVDEVTQDIRFSISTPDAPCDTFEIVDGEHSHLFMIVGDEIIFQPPDDAVDGEVYYVDISSCFDPGTPLYRVTYAVEKDINLKHVPGDVGIDTPYLGPIWIEDGPFDVFENVAPNTVLGTVLAEDKDGRTDNIEYSILPGHDGAMFELSSTGQLIFKDAFTPDYEDPQDEGADNRYIVSIRALDTASGLADAAQVTIHVRNLNEFAPVIDPFGDPLTIEENLTNVFYFTSTDGDLDDEARWSIVDDAAGSDSEFFDISAVGGRLFFKAPPDFETPRDADGDNIYTLQVVATDRGDALTGDNKLTHTVDVRVQVLDVNETPPVFTNTRQVTVLEGDTAVITLSASDIDEGDVLTFSIIGGVDQDFFELNGDQLIFSNAPDFEAPQDADGDNDYQVIVEVRDIGGLAAELPLTVTVGDAPEPPVAVDDEFVNISSSFAYGDNVLVNDYDPANPNDTLTVVQVNGASIPKSQFSLPSGARLLIDSATGTFVYDPTTAFAGLLEGETAIDGFSYTVVNSSGASATGLVTFHLVGQNDAPIARDDTLTLSARDSIAGDLFADNGAGVDLDVDGDAFVVSSLTGGGIAPGVWSPGDTVTLTTDGGRPVNFTLDADGGFILVTGDAFDAMLLGENDTLSLEYTLSDGRVEGVPAQIDIVVNADPRPPYTFEDVFVDDFDLDNIGENGFELINFHADATAIDVFEAGEVGRLLPGDDGQGVELDALEDPVILTSDMEFAFEAGVTYRLVIDAAANADGPLMTLGVNIDGLVDEIQALDPADGFGRYTFSFTPTQTVAAALVLTGPTEGAPGGPVLGEEGVLIDRIAIERMVNPQGPAAEALFFTVGEEDVFSGTAAASDPGGQNLIWSGLTQLHGRPINPAATALSASDGAFEFDASGAFDDLAAGETEGVSFVYTVTDADGFSDQQIIEVRVIGENDAPEISGDTDISMSEGGFLAANLTASDVDNDGLVWTLPDLGGVAPDEAGADNALFTIDAGGRISFKAPPIFVQPDDADGNNQYEILARVSDGDGGVDTHALTLTVVYGSPTAPNEVRVNTATDTGADLAGDYTGLSFQDAVGQEARDGFGLSLREALALSDAFDADVDRISFDPLMSGDTISLNGTRLTLESDVIIDGDLDDDGIADITLDAGGLSSVLAVRSGVVRLEGLVLTGGQPENTDTDFEGGALTVGLMQGGVGVSSADVTLAHVEIRGNAADIGATHFTYGTGGGAVVTAGSRLVAIDSVFADNTATGGGAVQVTGQSRFIADRTVFENNSVDSGRGGAVLLGVLSGSSGNTAASGDALILNSYATGNKGDGSFVWIVQDGSDLQVVNTTVALNDGDPRGAIVAQNAVTVDIIQSTFTGNAARDGGGLAVQGGDVDIVNSLIYGNAGQDTAGAADDIVFQGGGPEFFGQNWVGDYGDFNGQSTPGGQDPHLVPDGGALTDVFAAQAEVTVGGKTFDTALIADNGGPSPTAMIAQGGLAHDAGIDDAPIFIDETYWGYDVSGDGDASDQLQTVSDLLTDARGLPRVSGGSIDVGAVELVPPAGPTLTVDTVDDGQLDSADAGIEPAATYGATVSAEAEDGGGLSLREALLIADAFDADVDTITFDPALSGATILLNGTHLELGSDVVIDGDLDEDGAADITISGGDVSSVLAVHAGEVTLDGLVLANGQNAGSGAIPALAGALTVGRAEYTGSALQYLSSADVTLINSTVRDSLSVQSVGHRGEGGGAVVTAGSRLVAIDSVFSGNQALDGGGVHVTGDSTFIADGVLFKGNLVTGFGGGLSIGDRYGDTSGEVLLLNSLFTRNGGNSGNAIFLSDGGDIDIVNTLLVENGPGGSGARGGAIWADSGTLDLIQSTVTGNHTQREGGGVYIQGAEVTLTNSLVYGNHTISDQETADISYNGELSFSGQNWIGAIDHRTPGRPDPAELADHLYAVNRVWELFDPSGWTKISAYTVHSALLEDRDGSLAVARIAAGGAAQDQGDSNAAIDIDEARWDYDVNGDGALTALQSVSELSTDARGLARVSGAAIDIGAVELQDNLVAQDAAGIVTGGFSAGADTLLWAGDGTADTFDALAGVDTFDASRLVDNLTHPGVRVDLGRDAARADETGAVASETTDALSGFRNAVGSPAADFLFGDAQANRLEGGEGDDTIRGDGGADVLVGGAGADRLEGGSGGDAFLYLTLFDADGDAITDFGPDDVIRLQASGAELRSISVHGDEATLLFRAYGNNNPATATLSLEGLPVGADGEADFDIVQGTANGVDYVEVRLKPDLAAQGALENPQMVASSTVELRAYSEALNALHAEFHRQLWSESFDAAENAPHWQEHDRLVWPTSLAFASQLLTHPDARLPEPDEPSDQREPCGCADAAASATAANTPVRDLGQPWGEPPIELREETPAFTDLWS